MTLASSATTVPVTRQTFDDVFVPTYAPAAMVPVRGLGLELWDQSGKRYLDFTAGIAVSSLGHCHPVLVQALKDQSEKLWHLSNAYTNEPVLRLGLALTQATFADKVFFSNSGAEANEAALKLARKYASKKHGDKKTRIISCKNSFHGRTLFTVSVGGQPKYTEGFGPVPPYLTHVPFNDIEAAKAAMGDDVCAVMVEPVQGEGGVVPATQEYLQALRDLCTQFGAALIFDEVQTGVGRTGNLYAYMGYGVIPDILTTAKALGNGYPIGAMLTTNEFASVFVVGTHGTTYGGNPMAATVALNVINVISQPGFMERVREASGKVIAMLEGVARDYPEVFAVVRGQGLLLGMALQPAHAGKSKDITRACEALGLMLLVAGPDVVRLAPALIISDEQIAEGEQLMRAGIDAYLAAASK